MQPAIIVENISKMYHIGKAQQRHDTLRDLLMDAAKNFGRTLRRSKTDDQDLLWALKDISFEVQPGEVVGIIGRNGAGKSTLLKILSRIVEPTSGRAVMNGRVGSLLEVGTGFHPELTGRENIYLSGAILGMRRVEINRKLDEIIAFAEIEKFMDTPVKRYSSGMYVRLAFAVAAHLEPEILLVDEVLAVGDASFQKKCLGKMGNVAKKGRTVLFVSHNMSAVRALCPRVIALDKGNVMMDDHSDKVIDCYLSHGTADRSFEIQRGIYDFNTRDNEYMSGNLIVKRLAICNHIGEYTNELLVGLPAQFIIDVNGLSSHRDATVGLIIKNKYGEWVTSITTGMVSRYFNEHREYSERASLHIGKLPLLPSQYLVDISIHQHGLGRLDYIESAAEIVVVDNDVYGSGQQLTDYLGYFYLDGYWDVRNLGCQLELENENNK